MPVRTRLSAHPTLAAGALLAVAAIGFAWYLLSSRRRAREAEQQARTELEVQKHAAQAAAQAAALSQAPHTPVRDEHAGDADRDQ